MNLVFQHPRSKPIPSYLCYNIVLFLLFIYIPQSFKTLFESFPLMQRAKWWIPRNIMIIVGVLGWYMPGTPFILCLSTDYLSQKSFTRWVSINNTHVQHLILTGNRICSLTATYNQAKVPLVCLEDRRVPGEWELEIVELYWFWLPYHTSPTSVAITISMAHKSCDARFFTILKPTPSKVIFFINTPWGRKLNLTSLEFGSNSSHLSSSRILLFVFISYFVKLKPIRVRF